MAHGSCTACDQILIALDEKESRLRCPSCGDIYTIRGTRVTVAYANPARALQTMQMPPAQII